MYRRGQLGPEGLAEFSVLCNTLILNYTPKLAGEEDIRTLKSMAPFPMLVVSNLKSATRWYQKALGFRLVFEMPGPEGWPVLAHLRWPQDGHLLLVGDGRTLPLRDPSVPGITLTFPLSKGSVDEFAETASAQGADILVGPLDQPWHRREVTLKDPDGYRLTFVQA